MSFCDLFTQITLSSFYVLGNRLPVHEKIKSNSQKNPNYYLSRGLGSFAPFSNASETQQFSLPQNSPSPSFDHPASLCTPQNARATRKHEKCKKKIKKRLILKSHDKSDESSTVATQYDCFPKIHFPTSHNVIKT